MRAALLSMAAALVLAAHAAPATAHQALPPEVQAAAGAALRTKESTLPGNVERGRLLFERQTFGGNGRTCATCHRASRNFTIDVPFIRTLPKSDPLFVHERVPALAGLENARLLRERGLFLENLDGFDQPGVLRSANHTLGLRATVAPDKAGGHPLNGALGWSGDGSPGTGTLREFAIGAVVQHMPKTLARRPGVDFRLPTAQELDDLEAFQLSLGRQADPVNPESEPFVDPRVIAGRDHFFGTGAGLLVTRNGTTRTCSGCHGKGGANNASGVGQQRAIGVENHPRSPTCLDPRVPADGGFGVEVSRTVPRAAVCGTGTGELVYRGNQFFNPPSVIEAADTTPLFHNNVAATVEQAATFYTSDVFNASITGAGRAFIMTPQDIQEIGAYLRAINADQNLKEAVGYIDQRAGKSAAEQRRLWGLARSQAQDARNVLRGSPAGILFGVGPTHIRLNEALRLLAKASPTANDATVARVMLVAAQSGMRGR